VGLYVRLLRLGVGAGIGKGDLLRGPDHGAVLSRELPFGGRVHRFHQLHLVSPRGGGSRSVERKGHSAEFRGCLLQCGGLCRRGFRRPPYRGKFVVQRRPDTSGHARKEPSPGREGHERRAFDDAGRRQAELAIRLLQLQLHPHHGHLADGVDGGRGPCGAALGARGDGHRPGTVGHHAPVPVGER